MSGDNAFLKKLLEIFKVEATEHLKTISDNTLKLEKNTSEQDSKGLIENILRSAHSLKGSAHSVGMFDIVALCQALESVLLLLKIGKINVSTNLFDLIYKTIDTLETILASNGKKIPVSSLIKELNAIEESNQVVINTDSKEKEEKPKPKLETKNEIVNVEIKQEIIEEKKINENIKENIISETVQTEENEVSEQTQSPVGLADTVRISAVKLDSLLRQAEEMLTIKLVAEQKVKELNSTFEMFEVWEKDYVKNYAEIRTILQNIEREGKNQFSRLLESLSSNYSNTKLLKNRLSHLINLDEYNKNMAVEMVDNLLENIKMTLMLPFSSIMGTFPRIIRDISKEQKKEIELITNGTTIEIDKRILEEIKDALIHLIRNSMDHGLETSEDRIKNNKKPQGKIIIDISQVSSNKVEIAISDDGKGINVEEIKQIAINAGLISKDNARDMENSQALSLIFESGFSTSPIITDISGRGLGLAIVREKVEKLGGNVSVESELGKFTLFRISLPLTLSTFRGLIVRTGERHFVIPLFNVEYTIRLRRSEINTVEDKQVVLINEQLISFVRLDDVLQLPISEIKDKESEFIQVIIVTSNDKRIAFYVDEVINEQEVMIKNLGKHLVRVRNISGVTILGNGKIVPLINVQDLIKTVSNYRFDINKTFNKKEDSENKKSSILIAEDSITSRTLLRNILETAGYMVKTTIDGADAFSELMENENDYDLVISDVEMPRMNGFDLTEKIRATSKIAHLPVILITSLSDKKDKERGIDAGANAYVVKTDFDQSNLLDIIPRLL